MKYKVVEEYDRFYLGESKKGYKKCFEKYKYHPDENGYITEESENDYHESIPKEKLRKMKTGNKSL